MKVYIVLQNPFVQQDDESNHAYSVVFFYFFIFRWFIRMMMSSRVSFLVP